MTILKFHDFSRFSMTVRTLKHVHTHYNHTVKKLVQGGYRVQSWLFNIDVNGHLRQSYLSPPITCM